MKKTYLLLLILGLSGGLKASHIVGGDIQLEYLSESSYTLRLNLYYDLLNTTFNVETTEPIIMVHIFSKKTNKVIFQNVQLNLRTHTDVQYTNPNCTSGQLKTRYLTYEDVIQLPPSIFNEPEGYYVIWERCCRNKVIDNIDRPDKVGMVFYLEFPAVFQDNKNFYDTTPFFKTPSGDYLCMNTEFTFDFSAVDKDGDSLVYSLTTPWIGNSDPNFPGQVIPSTLQGGIPPFPAPYTQVTWLDVDGFQFSALHPLPTDLASNQTFEINPHTGLIRVTPNRTGLFVFAVLCEEYRNGRRIGAVRRDFQFLVLDCPVNHPPSVEMQAVTLSENNSGNFFYQNGDTLYLSQSSDQLCTSIWLKDPDLNETLHLSLIPKNFQPRQSYFSLSQGVVNGSNDSLEVQFCWPQCLFSSTDAQGNNVPYVMDIVVTDNRCPRWASDTLHLKVISIPIINHPPLVYSNASLDPKRTYTYYIEKNVGENFHFDVFAEDTLDNGTIELIAVGKDFDLNDVGMSFENKSGIASLQSTFDWQTDCASLQNSEQKQYIIDFITTDQNVCGNKTDTVSVALVLNDIPFDDNIFLPTNAFSPNGDQWNQTFTMNNLQDIAKNLPEESCLYQFEKIEIFTRWGIKVFESRDKNFVWDGGGQPTGVYFYRINFKNKIYKGSVSLLK